jgi:predicted ABC-type ATPase
MKPTIYLIAGANGVGKTTFAREFLPKEVKCVRFMNADEVARGLSPFAPEAAAIRAGRIVLTEIRSSIQAGESFGWESTLSGRGHVRILEAAKALAYQIELHYLAVTTPEVCVERVTRRVAEGGHHVPSRDVRRRFERSIRNLIEVYLGLADRWTIWDATTSEPAALLTWSRNEASDVRSILMP